MIEANNELAEVLNSFKKRDNTGEDCNQTSSERRKKLSRMQAVRKTESDENVPPIVESFRAVKEERSRDLKTIDTYRTASKRDGILNVLSAAITTEYIIHPSFGKISFFEFSLRNPYNTAHTVEIECEDPELRLVIDSKEWKYLKIINDLLDSPTEEGLFSSSDEGTPQIYLRPKERVNVPFKFLTFKADNTVQATGAVNIFKASAKKEKLNDESRIIRVYCRTVDSRNPVAVLKLKIEPLPHVIDQTFRFHHPEHSFFRQSLRLPPLNHLPGAVVGNGQPQQIYVKCSDPNVIASSRPVLVGEPHDVTIKVSCGAAPQIKKFYLAIYTEKHLAHPIQIWQILIHSLQRIDIACTEGQTTRTNVVLKGGHSSKLVKAYVSHPMHMSVSPSEPFTLTANSLYELAIGVRGSSTGVKFMYINVVDVDCRTLFKSWLVCVNCKSPEVGKSFEVKVATGRAVNKRLAFTNPYASKKAFHILTSRPDLLHFKETHMELMSQETYNIGLRLVPVGSAGVVNILVFINDEDDKTEETFSVTVQYIS